MIQTKQLTSLYTLLPTSPARGQKFLTKKPRTWYAILFMVILCVSCNSEDANDCLQTNGDPITRSIELPAFTAVRIDNDLSIEITQGDTQQITIDTRENLWSDLAFFVEDGTFIARDNNGCNLFRDGRQTTVRLTTPNLDFIKNNSSGEVRSNGVLNFPTLRLESITTLGLEDVNKSGDFFLDLNCEDLRIVANGNSDFFISGNALSAMFNFSDEFPLLEAANLVVQDLSIRHAGAAPMVVNPQNSITGQIRATGDVISHNQPAIVEVEELFTGRLIFED